jgi:hypothetical protein
MTYIIIAVLACATLFGCVYWYTDHAPEPNNINPGGNTGGNTGGNPTVPPINGAYGAPLYISVANAITSTTFTTSATTVNTLAAEEDGTFKFLQPSTGLKQITTQSANPQSEGKTYYEGQSIIAVITCTGNPSNGLDYYPGTFYIPALAEGAKIYEIKDISAFQLSGTNPVSYRITVNTGNAEVVGTVHKSAVTLTQYWDLGTLGIYPRDQASGADIYMNYKGVTALSAVSDASTWVDTGAEVTANQTLAGTGDYLYIGMTCGDSQLTWGRHFFAYDTSGYIHEYGAVLIIATGLGIQTPDAVGGQTWQAYNPRGLTAESAYFLPISPDAPMTGTLSWQTKVSLNLLSGNAANTQFAFKAWVLDCQQLDGFGTTNQPASTAVPTSSGGFVDTSTDYGVGAVVHAVAPTISNGATATSQLLTYLTTPS